MGREQPVIFIIHSEIIKPLTFRARQLDNRNLPERLRLCRAYEHGEHGEGAPEHLMVNQLHRASSLGCPVQWRE